MRSSGACTTNSPTSHTARVAGAPAASTPASSRRAARQPPRVCAVNAARTDRRWSGVWWNAAARTASHGPSGVTGLSEPSASTTPAAASAANGLRVAAR
jgi:hypothetical protein